MGEALRIQFGGGGGMTGETFTITKSYKIFQGEPKGEPVDEPNENQLFGWLRARGYFEDEASKLIELREKYEEVRATEETNHHRFIRWLIEHGRLSDW